MLGIFVAGLALLAPASQDELPSFEVRTAQQLVEAIGSNRILRLRGEIDVTAAKGFSSEHVEYREEFDGPELVVKGVQNLVLVGADPLGMTPVTASPRYADVIQFENCDGVSVQNLLMGHSEAPGECSGGVLNFINCSEATVTKCALFGSGTYGVQATDTGMLSVSDVTITDCTYGAVTLTHVGDATFYNCDIEVNKGFDMIEVRDSVGVRFNRCTFAGNSGMDGEDWGAYHLFAVTEGEPVEVNECLLLDNVVDHLGNDPSKVVLWRCLMDGNTFRKGEFPAKG